MHLARYALALRSLKWSNCINKVDIEDVAEADLTLIRAQLSDEENQRFTRLVTPLKELVAKDIKDKIEASKRTTGTLDKICSRMEQAFKQRHAITKRQFMERNERAHDNAG